MELNRGFYIGNEYFKPDGNEFEIKSPYDGNISSVIHMAGDEEREMAVNLAVDSFNLVSKLKSIDRIELLFALKLGIEDRRNEIARTISKEAGKPLKQALAEIDRSTITIDCAIDTINNPHWEFMPLDTSERSDRWRYGLIKRFPIGVVVGITPFNFPINLVMHKLAPAIASGCPFILKPASQVASTALILGEILNKSGAIPGQITIIPMSGKTADAFSGDDRIKLITFTGSSEVGWNIKAKARKTKVSLELGGNAGCVIEPDSDLDYVTDRIIMGAFSNQGQVCISTQRLYVHDQIFNDFAKKFLAKVSKLKMGDPLDESTDIGPMISNHDAMRAMQWIDEAVKAGAKILCGGNHNGTMFEPTVLENPPETCRVIKDEVFAPIVSLIRYDDFNFALNAVNNSNYGLQAGIFTRDMDKAMIAFHTWQVGGVIVNDVPTFRVDSMPYGGTKDSGIGREGPKYVMEEMSEIRIMVVNKP